MHSTSAVACGMKIMQAWYGLIVSVTPGAVFLTSSSIHSCAAEFSTHYHSAASCGDGFDQFVTLTNQKTDDNDVLPSCMLPVEQPPHCADIMKPMLPYLP